MLSGLVDQIVTWIINLTPVGVFAIVAVTAGSVTGDMLQRLEVYFIAFAAAAGAPVSPVDDAAVRAALASLCDGRRSFAELREAAEDVETEEDAIRPPSAPG